MNSRRPHGSARFLLVLVAAILATLTGFVWWMRRSAAADAIEARQQASQFSAESSSLAGTEPQPDPSAARVLQGIEDPTSSEPEPTADSAEAPAQATPVSGSRATALLDLAADSFRSATPDLTGLEQALGLLAQASTVDPDSVRKDPNTGFVHGKLLLPDSDLAASFQISGSRYQINFEPRPGNPLPGPFVARGIDVSFLDDEGKAANIGTVVQYHPNPKQSSADALQPGEEAYVGWAVAIGAEGTMASPLTMKQAADGMSWTVGNSQSFPKIEMQNAPISPAYAAWLAKLSAYSQ